MLSSRAQWKSQAKASIKTHYWPAVGAGVILAISTTSAAFSGGSSHYTYSGGKTLHIFENLTKTNIGYIAACISVLVVIILVVFVLHPLEYGARTWYLRSTENNGSEVGKVFSGFNQENYMRSVETLFFRDLYCILWCFLFVIPGIVKMYQYYFVPYILADHPEMSGREVLELSKQMTEGHKMDLFILDISFIFWYILAGLTWGIAEVFYVAPYIAETNAFCYQDFVMNGADPTRPNGDPNIINATIV